MSFPDLLIDGKPSAHAQSPFADPCQKTTPKAGAHCSCVSPAKHSVLVVEPAAGHCGDEELHRRDRKSAEWWLSKEAMVIVIIA